MSYYHPTEELAGLYAAYREAEAAETGARAFANGLRAFLPLAARATEEAQFDRLHAATVAAHDAYRAAWNAAYPGNPLPSLDELYEASYQVLFITEPA